MTSKTVKKPSTQDLKQNDLPEKPSKELLNYLGVQLKAASPFKGNNDYLEELLQAYKPKDAIEAMLLTQMAATHNLSITVLLNAGIEARSSISPNLQKSTTAVKLLNLFTRQMEALASYRGKASTQKIVVEQVKVEQGGQAVVGNIIQGDN